MTPTTPPLQEEKEKSAAQENNRIMSIIGNLFSQKPSLEVTYEMIMRAITDENLDLQEPNK